MKIASFLYPQFTSIDLIAPITVWQFVPGAQFDFMIEYAPEPPYRTGRPELADEATLATAREFMAMEFSEPVVEQAAQRLATRRIGASRAKA